MRAGSYAVWQGEVFECYYITDSKLLLFRSALHPQPEGFEPSRYRGWSREVHISEVGHRFSVTTTAVWRGHRVEVDSIRDGKAALSGKSPRPGDAPKHPSIMVERYGEWEVLVPAYELTEVVEKYHDSI